MLFQQPGHEWITEDDAPSLTILAEGNPFLIIFAKYKRLHRYIIGQSINQ
jgi:hypothetical protein